MAKKNGNGGPKRKTAVEVLLDIYGQQVEMRAIIEARLGELPTIRERVDSIDTRLANVETAIQRALDFDARLRAVEVDLTEVKRRVAGRRG